MAGVAEAVQRRNYASKRKLNPLHCGACGPVCSFRHRRAHVALQFRNVTRHPPIHAPIKRIALPEIRGKTTISTVR